MTASRGIYQMGAESPGDGPGVSPPSRQFLTLPFKIPGLSDHLPETSSQAAQIGV